MCAVRLSVYTPACFEDKLDSIGCIDKQTDRRTSRVTLMLSNVFFNHSHSLDNIWTCPTDNIRTSIRFSVLEWSTVTVIEKSTIALLYCWTCSVEFFESTVGPLAYSKFHILSNMQIEWI